MSQGPDSIGESPERNAYMSAFNDLAVRIRDGASFSGSERHGAFLNTGGEYFADISAISGFGLPTDGRGMALSDWDQDGDLDIWTSNRTAPRLQFFQNRIPPVGSRWIAFRLEGDPGRACSRDAIGSQVEVVRVNGSGRRVKTLHAGNGLMSQSSKWVYFGLGKDEEIASVRVRWAGGDAVEDFGGIEANKRWRLRQGATAAEAGPVREVPAIAEGALELPAPTGVVRIRLSQPLKTPDLIYEDFEGEQRNVSELSGRRAVLINFWATWCAPCVDELKAFAAAQEQFESSRLTVLALNVDHLGPDSKNPEAFLEEHGFAMSGGIAGPEILELLEAAIRKSVYRHRELPVPTSFLIDRGGWLSAIYKGPVAVDQVLADQRSLGKGPDEARISALPFRGIWAEQHFATDPTAIARAYMEGGYLEDAKDVLDRFLEKNDAPPGNNSIPAENKRNMQLASVHFHLAEVAVMGRQQATAKSAYVTSLKYNPRQLPTLNNLAWLLATSSDPDIRDGEAAVKHAEFMLRAPGVAKNPSLLGTAAAAYAAAGRFAEAVNTTRRIIALLEERGMETEARKHRERLKRYQRNEALSL